ncbi:hypothetical protein TUM4637_01360 [Shewanella hafniensis]|nr:hypothetical protein TUM4637_01360 [Shewanella hafniensis]
MPVTAKNSISSNKAIDTYTWIIRAKDKDDLLTLNFNGALSKATRREMPPESAFPMQPKTEMSCIKLI